MADYQIPVIQTPDGSPPETQPRWRRDFPIDTDEDAYVARRDFTKFLVLTSFAFVVGQVWIGVQSLVRRRKPRAASKRVAAADQVPVGGAISFMYPGEHDPCLLVRTGPETFLAYGDKCTHLSCAVVPDFKEGLLRCPCHHGFFDLATGRPLAGPPRRPLPRITLEVRDGSVWATGVELRTV